MAHVLIGELLLQGGAIDELALGMALAHQRHFGGRLGDALVGLRLVTEAQLVDALGRQLDIRAVELGGRTIPSGVLRIVPERLLRRHHCFPVGFLPERGSTRHPLNVAFADPRDVAAVDEVQFAAGMPIRAVLAGKRDIAQALERHFGGPRAQEHAVPCPPVAGPIELRPADELEPMLLVDVREARNFRRVGS